MLLSKFLRSITSLRIFTFNTSSCLTHEAVSHNHLIWVNGWSLIQLMCTTQHSSVVTVAWPPTSSSVLITNCPFLCASPSHWNQLPVFHLFSLILIFWSTSFWSYLLLSNSPLQVSPSIAPSFFALFKIHLIHKSIPLDFLITAFVD